MTSYTKDDVRFHSDGFGRDGRPAVNVKVHGSIRDAHVWDAFRASDGPDEGFTLDWIDENVSDERLDAIFWHVCEAEYEYLEGWATGTDDAGDALFPDDRVKLYREGRSAGWIVVDGLPDIEDWDAVRLARWRKFERIATSIAAGIPEQMLSSIYINEYQAQQDEDTERERAARQDIATVTA